MERTSERPIPSALSGAGAGESPAQVAQGPQAEPASALGKPAIGVTWRPDQSAESFVCTLQAIEAAGGAPVALPMARADFLEYEDGRFPAEYCEDGALSPRVARLVRGHTWRDSDAAELVGSLPAIVFPGGEDISPALFAEPEQVRTREGFSPERDVSDYLLMSYCLERDIPVLAICRGMQVLSVVSGARMIQDIPSYLEGLHRSGGCLHRNTPKPSGEYRDFAFHDVRVTREDSLFHRIVKADRVHAAPSWHHQAALSVEGTALRVSGVCDTAGVELIEAVERVDKSFVLGLQFHPEIAVVRKLDALSLSYFSAIVEAANPPFAAPAGRPVEPGGLS